jgi:hypothetical protein
MKMNHRLGFEPVTYDRLTRDDKFWEQCRNCVHYGILEANRRQKCLCTAMLFTPEKGGHDPSKTENLYFEMEGNGGQMRLSS